LNTVEFTAIAALRKTVATQGLLLEIAVAACRNRTECVAIKHTSGAGRALPRSWCAPLFRGAAAGARKWHGRHRRPCHFLGWLTLAR